VFLVAGYWLLVKYGMPETGNEKLFCRNTRPVPVPRPMGFQLGDVRKFSFQSAIRNPKSEIWKGGL
jgi:hypothetical protein